jgi:peptidoglycan/xylan/chitin deacetylase (PgdA/CDA1 family)
MILNGHVVCWSNWAIREILLNMTVSASRENKEKYSQSLMKHVWTFDDALTDQLLDIYLESFQSRLLNFHFFICPKLIDEWSIGNKDYVRAQLRNPDAELLSWDEIGSLVEYGNLIGSHGVDHTSFVDMSEDQFEYQMEYSRELIKSRTGRLTTTFAFPFGHVGSKSIEVSLKARKYYSEVYLSDNSLKVGQLADNVFNRRHAEFGVCALRGIFIGSLNILFGIKKWRSL